MSRVEYRQDDGVRLVADVTGHPTGPRIILAHGGGQTRHSWAGAARHLADTGYRVINYDARGHGESDWSKDHKYSTARRWIDMRQILDASGAGNAEIGRTQSPPDERVAIVGASMGGATALFGVSQGYRPDALILVDIAPNSNREGMERVRTFMASGLGGYATLDEAAEAVAAYNPSRPRPLGTTGLRKNLRRHANGRWYWHWDPGTIDVEIDAERQLMASTMDAIVQAKELPVLLVRGLQSEIVTDCTVAEFRSRLPRLEVADVGGAGHMVAGDRNDAFNSAVLEFLRRQLPLPTQS